MAGSYSSLSYEDDEPMADINVTPLVDVTLVLLIVFMITVPVIVGSAPINVDLPESNSILPEVADTPLAFSLKTAEGGELQVYLNEQPIDEAGIRRMFQGDAMANAEARVSLSADKRIPYGEVVRFVDLLESLGLSKLSLETRHVEPQ